MKINSKVCADCVFAQGHKDRGQRIAELDGSKFAHKITCALHPNVWCKGYYEAGKNGEVKHPETLFATILKNKGTDGNPLVRSPRQAWAGEMTLLEAFNTLEYHRFIEFEDVQDSGDNHD